MPESIPLLSANTLRSWKELPYSKVVVEVASLFICTKVIPREDLEGEVVVILFYFNFFKAVVSICLEVRQNQTGQFVACITKMPYASQPNK